MFEIKKDFVGGNISVISQTESDVYLENELRDTNGDWFYWAFCVEGAQGKEINFHFGKHRLGYFGPAVSHDLKSWHWLEECDGNSFRYSFGENESRVYFAHNLLYHPERFILFAKERGLEVEELCKSRHGRSVPCISVGDGKERIILTSRHHACEATGSYVLEGVLDELIKSPIPDTRIFCVPFVDYDGVIDGDQGKGRAPRDHNRDYADVSVYPETAAIREYADRYGCDFGFDFHSPWHRGGENDNIFIVRNRADMTERFDRFSELLEAECGEDSMRYKKENDHPAATGWNQPSANFSFTMHSRPECKLAFTLESAYFGAEENKVSAERLIALGRAFARALKKYIRGGFYENSSI